MRRLIKLGLVVIVALVCLAAIGRAAEAATTSNNPNVSLLYGPSPAKASNQAYNGTTWVTCKKCGTTIISHGKVHLRLNKRETLIVAYIDWATPAGGFVTTTWDGTPISTNDNGNTYFDSAAYVYSPGYPPLPV